MDIKGEVIFLGFNSCARRVIPKLREAGIVDEDKRLVVISKTRPPEEPWLDYVCEDYTEGSIYDRIDWEDTELAIIFHEKDEGKTESDADIKTVVATLRIPDKVRVIAEIIEEDYAPVIQGDIKGDIELIYKERFDANLIANTIINPGKTTELLRDMVDHYGTKLETMGLSDFSEFEELTVKEFKKILLEKDRVTFLGIMKEGNFDPILNPNNDEVIESGDIIYCLAESE